MADKSIKGRSPLLKGGRVGFSRAGSVGNLPWVRGTSRPGVKKAPRGAQHKEAIKQEKRWKKLDTKVKGKVVPGPEKGKYPGIDQAMKNIKKSGNIFGKAKSGKV
tara:strand:- start:501 stop:815 length:315 start_codon:yes stop_codon:yes gene_type:complete